MIYLNSFNFASFNNDLDFQTGENCYNTKYPFGILSQHKIECINFEPITIFYGGNGSGKTTALNIIAEKLHLQRDTLYNKSNFYDNYLKLCKYNSRKIPFKSRIITSDDVFEFTMNLRHINEGIDRRREELFEEYDQLKSQSNSFKLKTLADYDEFKKLSGVKNINKTNFVQRMLPNNIREQSNGESGFMYFTNKIQSDALYLLDEPENSLSPERQQELLQFIQDSARFYNCQFIIATHSPFLLSIKDAKIYDFDENPVAIKPWTELKNVQEYYNFFKRHEKEFN
jgi:predicted ATPase